MNKNTARAIRQNLLLAVIAFVSYKASEWGFAQHHADTTGFGIVFGVFGSLAFVGATLALIVRIWNI